MTFHLPLKTGGTVAIIALTMAASLTSPAYAQLSNVDIAKARAHFSNAQDAFKTGNYSKTLESLKKAEDISGETGTRLLGLEARALYKLERYEDAMSVMDEFYASEPSDTDRVAIDAILLEIDAKIEAEQTRKRKADEQAREDARIAPLIEAETTRKQSLVQSNPFTATSRLIKSGQSGSRGDNGDQGESGGNGRWARQRVPIPGISASLSSPAYNEDGYKAGPGSDGDYGGSGRDGGKIRLTIREIPVEYAEPLGFIEVLDYNDRTVLASGYWDFATTLKINAAGGQGGRGGSGGTGGTGGTGADGSYEARRSSSAGEGGPGGNGGDGGRGGSGGDGGTVRIEIIGSTAFKDSVLTRLTSDVSSGSAGAAGSAGSRGRGGQGGRHASGRRAYDGSDGYRGSEGSGGRDGNKGSSTYTHKTLVQLQAEIDEKAAELEATRRQAEQAAAAAKMEAERVAEAERVEAERMVEHERKAAEARSLHFSVVENFAYTKPSSKLAFNAGDAAKATACALKFSTGPTVDVDAAPCLRTAPEVPQAAMTSGYCTTRFDVDQQGHTANIKVVGCTDPIFSDPSYAAVNQWFYTPRIDNGKVVERPYVESTLRFDLTDETGALIPQPAGQTLKPVPSSQPVNSTVSFLERNEGEVLTDDISEKNAQPLVRIPPIMPPRAKKSGHCNVRFNVRSNGSTFDVETLYCTQPLFEIPTIKSVQKWKYNPKIQNGRPVDRVGVESKIAFRLTDHRGNLIPE